MATHCGDIEIAFTEPKRELVNMWFPFGNERKILSKGWTKDAGRRSLSEDLIWDKDVAIRLRDGTILYGDVFRAASMQDEKLPAILPWSPYGKTGTGNLSLDMFPFRVGIPRDQTSGLEKWEAPDPAEWCPRGYAVVNVDARGTFHSEGDKYVYGTQEGRDGHDTVEWIGTQPWCNGSVALAGNSWLGSMQWFIAAEKPSHLKAIAPWEGLGDFYRESLCRGGIPDHEFWDALFTMSQGENREEDSTEMLKRYPLWNAYWEDKKPKLGQIDVPMYTCASYSSGLHTEGSLRGFFFSSSKEKWLRIHHTQEWHDLYQPGNIDEMQRFFDHYLKGIDNGWENTPKMRLSMLGYNRPSIVNRPIDNFPPNNFRYKTFFLNTSDRSLSTSPPKENSSASYQADDVNDPGFTFVHTFDKYTELCGFSRVKLFMSTNEHDDMDVYVVIRKLDKSGKALHHFNIPFKDLPEGTTEDQIPYENVWRYVGPNGKLRASHRAVVPEPGMTPEQREAMSDAYVWHPHDKEEKLTAGEIIEMDVGLWAGGVVFDEGESMSLEIKGSLVTMPEFEFLKDSLKYYNVGRHIINTGPDYPAKLQLYLSP